MSSTLTKISQTPGSWGGTANVHRNTYRIFCVLAGVLNPLFGGVYQFTDPTVIDPPWARLVLSVGILLLLSLSYMVRWVEKNFIGLVRGYFYVMIVFIAGLTMANGFSPNYALGLLFGFTVMGFAFSLGLQKKLSPLRSYLLFSVMMTVAAGVLTYEPEVSLLIVMVCVSSTALVIYVVAGAKMKVEDSAEASEHRYHTLMNAANDAILIGDPESGLFVDANEKAIELLGRTHDIISRMPIGELFPAKNRDRSLALFEAHVFKGESLNDGITVARQDGTTVAVDLSASLIDVDGREYIQGIFRDATERHRYEDQLIRAKEQAEQLLLAKTNLLNNVSHELRTPLTSILGFAEILSESLEGRDKEHAYHITLSAQRLFETVNSVLGLAHLEDGGPTLDIKPLGIAHVLDETVALLNPIAEQKGLSLRFLDHSGQAQAFADEAGLRRIVNNLIGNAIKFTKEGEVEVEVSADDSYVLIRINDTGVGIAPAFLPQIFEEFQQESTGLSRSHEGNGLGLAISKRLVDMMNGSIEVESIKGRGSSFTVALPRAATREEIATGQAPAAWVSRQNVLRGAAQS